MGILAKVYDFDCFEPPILEGFVEDETSPRKSMVAIPTFEQVEKVMNRRRAEIKADMELGPKRQQKVAPMNETAIVDDKTGRYSKAVYMKF